MRERVYDVAVFVNRKIGKDDRCKQTVGNAVNVRAALFDNSIGAPILNALWQGPNIDEKQNAFYYGRVLEIPTPNWTVYDTKKSGTELPEGESVSN